MMRVALGPRPACRLELLPGPHSMATTTSRRSSTRLLWTTSRRRGRHHEHHRCPLPDCRRRRSRRRRTWRLRVLTSTRCPRPARASPPSARSVRLQFQRLASTRWRTRLWTSRRSTTRSTTRARRYELTVLFCFPLSTRSSARRQVYTQVTTNQLRPCTPSKNSITGTGTRTTTTASRSAPSGTDYNSATPPRSSNTSLVNWTRCTWGSRN